MELRRFKEEYIISNLPKTRKEWVWFVLIILVVIILGVVFVNSYLGLQYKATLLQSPCALCDDFMEKKLFYSSDIDIEDFVINLSNNSVG